MSRSCDRSLSRMSWSNSMSTSTRKKASNSLRRINSSQSSVRAMSPRVRHWYLRSSPGLNLMVKNDSTQPPCAYSDDTPPTKTRIIPPGGGEVITPALQAIQLLGGARPTERCRICSEILENVGGGRGGGWNGEEGAETFSDFRVSSRSPAPPTPVVIEPAAMAPAELITNTSVDPVRHTRESPLVLASPVRGMKW